MATTGEYIDLHELAKGWKAAIARATDPATKHEAQIRNDRGNLPLHSATSFRAPIEVAESLLQAYPEAASITNNYGNLPLHFTAWKKGPLEVERVFESNGTTEEMEEVLALLLDIYEGHPHALYSAGINPENAGTMDSMMEEEAQLIEDALCPPDDTVEIALSKLVGLEAVKNQIRGMRRTMELVKSAQNGKVAHPSHIVLEGNPGVGKKSVATVLADVLYEIGVVKTQNFMSVGRDELIDRKSEARTIQKTRKVLERAKGGVLLLNESYTLLPSTARPRGRDHGGAALREIARTLSTGNPLIILTGSALELQRILSSEIGFKTHFLTRIEFADPSPSQVARIFMGKMSEKGLVPGDGVTVDYLAELISTNTDEDWRLERNGRIADLLLNGVRAELRKRFLFNDESSKVSFSPIKMMSPGASSRMPAATPDEIFVTVEDVQNAIVNGM
ncbi:hypothetical protein FRACYDRAFT_274316 [Fragilariopsis cylindrus CCMP1102]|uniref:AAA+ ATPase domain-containing protein n=1 Tax=Fragilariopsis cylindrus CCMP1102 TaxID=635003 RepID=A0A1E7FRS7_9STRA|nr:hypothetical protein FRACYDRAFT_274316 [Fragilariopsis cylindrus CCMP1102]|eukprot:OEU20805.1 hypothetical protein FRACYDRAFT_274316 [Fragilariopsis cylindrus CCMP1102]